MTTLVVERGRVVEFSSLPKKSIALDGYCQGPTLDIEGERFSFDHHDKCIRLVTRATCQQVMDALLLGLDPEGFTIYVNDVDGDTALSVWLLLHPNRAKENLVRELVEVVGAMDAHGPAYPCLSGPFTALLTNFFDGAMAPEREARKTKTYATTNLPALLGECVEGISALINGEKWEAPRKETRSFEVKRMGLHGWVLCTSNDFVFDLIYKAGHTRAVVYRELLDGSYEYTLAKKSELVSNFPVGPHSKPGTLLYALAKEEAGWGGGSTIGGAPRNPDGSRSKLPPSRVFEIIQDVLR